MTKNINLRPMNLSDIQHYNKWSNDYDVVQYTYPIIKTFSMDETKDFYEKVTKATNSKTLMIEDALKKQPIGITSLINIDQVNRNAEFIIDIGEKGYWGKGIGRSVTEDMMDLAFETYGLNRLSLRVFSFNTRAISLYKSLGFVEEGRTRQAINRYDKWHDIVHMGILCSEYNK